MNKVSDGTIRKSLIAPIIHKDVPGMYSARICAFDEPVHQSCRTKLDNNYMFIDGDGRLTVRGGNRNRTVIKL